jgi:6 kDa early secretory antigenic target
MANITVTPEQLSSISQQLTSGAGTIEGTLTQLGNLVSPLHSEWQGAAQAAFENLWNEWQTSARNLHDALTGIARLTGQAAANYEQTEQGIASSFSS